MIPARVSGRDLGSLETFADGLINIKYFGVKWYKNRLKTSEHNDCESTAQGLHTQDTQSADLKCREVK